MPSLGRNVKFSYRGLIPISCTDLKKEMETGGRDYFYIYLTFLSYYDEFLELKTLFRMGCYTKMPIMRKYPLVLGIALRDQWFLPR